MRKIFRKLKFVEQNLHLDEETEFRLMYAVQLYSHLFFTQGKKFCFTIPFAYMQVMKKKTHVLTFKAGNDGCYSVSVIANKYLGSICTVFCSKVKTTHDHFIVLEKYPVPSTCHTTASNTSSILIVRCWFDLESPGSTNLFIYVIYQTKKNIGRI